MKAHYGIHGIDWIHDRAGFLPCSHLRIIISHVVLVPLLWWAPLVGMPIVVPHIRVHLSLHAVVLELLLVVEKVRVRITRWWQRVSVRHCLLLLLLLLLLLVPCQMSTLLRSFRLSHPFNSQEKGMPRHDCDPESRPLNPQTPKPLNP